MTQPAPPKDARACAQAEVDRILELDQFGAKLGLDTIRSLLRLLGDPQAGLPVVLVAGTNGKGSTSALIASIALAAGYSVGLYTSPHLERPEERLRIDRRAIDPGELAPLLVEVLAAYRDRHRGAPTYFETLTAAALLWFRRRGVELAVLEVGLGGRLDATNATSPSLSVITGIDFDHQEHLGDTLAEIAREKAGIMRRGVPAVVWGEPGITRQRGADDYAAALRERALALGAPLHDAAEEVHWRALEPACRPGWRLELATRDFRYALGCPLLGEHQARNLAVAVRAAELLQARGFSRIDQHAVARGTAAWRWPGRLEEIALGDGHRVLLDGAHNASGALSLARFLAERPAPAAPLDLLFGCLRTKEAELMLGALLPLARRVVLTRSRAGRAREPEELLQVARALGATAVAAPDLPRALELLAEDRAPLLVVAGSLYLQGELRPLLRRRYGVPAPVADQPL